MTQVEEIKSKLKIEELIGETLTVIGRGRTLTTKEHDSLKIFTTTQSWHWFSQAKGGDIFDWYQIQHKCDFRTALEELAKQAAVELRQLTEVQRTEIATQRAAQTVRFEILEMAASYYAAVLWSPDGELGRRYCAGRGWTDETIKRERIGFCPAWGDKKALSAQEPLHRQLMAAGHAEHPLAKAVLSIPGGMIVYTHQDRGRVVYLSARSIQGKRHYNLPELVELPEGSGNLVEAAGMKQPYLNDPVRHAGRGGARVLVEGQADAISLGQLGIDAAALCGLALGDLPGEFSHIGLDNEAKVARKSLDLALSIDPLCRLIAWPGDAKDANDWLKSEPNEAEVGKLLADSLPALHSLAFTIRTLKGDERKALLRRLVDSYNQLDEMEATDMKPRLAQNLGESISQFNRFLKAREDELKKENGDAPAGERFEYSAGGSQGGTLWEQCIVWNADGAGTTQYAVRNPKGEIKYQNSVDVGGVSYVPYKANLGLIRNKRIVLFPERAEEYGSEKALNEEIRLFIHDFLDVDPFYERLASYYVMFSWLYDLFENLPYLRALGDYGTGKTRFIQTIGVLCYRPMLVSGASSVSPIFRLIDMFRGTLIVDEADLSNSDSDNEIVKIINVGYQKGGAVMRAEKDPLADIYAPEVYDVFGPKILATRKPFTDRAVESRCLTRRTTTQRPRPEIPYTLGESFWRRSQTIRNKLLMYRMRNHAPVEIDHKLADESVEPRLNQVTMALKTIIKDEGMRRDIDMFIRAYNDVLISDRQMTLPAVVVQALVDLHYSKATNLLGQDERDFTMKGIAARCAQIVSDFDPDTKVYAKLISKILTDDLGLIGRARHPTLRRDMLKYEESDLTALMLRFGIEAPQQI